MPDVYHLPATLRASVGCLEELENLGRLPEGLVVPPLQDDPQEAHLAELVADSEETEAAKREDEEEGLRELLPGVAFTRGKSRAKPYWQFDRKRRPRPRNWSEPPQAPVYEVRSREQWNSEELVGPLGGCLLVLGKATRKARAALRKAFGPTTRDEQCSRQCIAPRHAAKSRLRRRWITQMTAEQRAVARELAASGIKQRLIAEQLNVSESAISRLVNGQTWEAMT